MESSPHTARAQRSAAARIEIPVTSRGIVLTDRACWVLLGAAMAAAAALILYLGRGLTFNSDELHWFYASPGLTASDVLQPYNGNLIVTSRLAFKAGLEAFGAGYVPFRVLGIATVLVCVGLFYALVKRRIGAVPALVPAVLLLFFGSADGIVAAPIGFTTVASIAAGLAALLAIEGDDRRGDIYACILLTLSVVTWGTGLAFVVGIAAYVGLRDRDWRRFWIPLVPAAIYAAWWVWALGQPGSSDDQTTLSNVLLIPAYVAESLATVVGAIAGVGYDFGATGQRLEWGAVLATVAVVALALRVRRGGVPASLWAVLAIVLSYWALSAVAVSEARPPGAPRYLYMGAIGVLLVAADAARPVRFTPRLLTVLAAALAVSLATNLALLRDEAAWYRSNATGARAVFTTLELARDRVDPRFDPGPLGVAGPNRIVAEGAGAYFEASDSYGSLGTSLSELQRQSPAVREAADQVLASALRLGVRDVGGSRAANRCELVRAPAGGEGVSFELPAGGAVLRASAPRPSELVVGRFGGPSVVLGTLAASKPALLEIPVDGAQRPWSATVPNARAVRVCAP